jgi:uncharacterized protein YukE
MGFIKKALMRLARKILQGVLDEITKQLNIVQNEVIEGMTRFVTQGFDDIWRGEDADQFKQKVMRLAVPNGQEIVNVVSRTHTALNRAAESIEAADQKANQMVSDLQNTFSRIF